jgi:hypothetical protein
MAGVCAVIVTGASHEPDRKLIEVDEPAWNTRRSQWVPRTVSRPLISAFAASDLAVTACRQPCQVPELGHGVWPAVQAAASYSLIKPPRIGRRRILPPIGSETGASGRGGCSCSDRCGRRRL